MFSNNFWIQVTTSIGLASLLSTDEIIQLNKSNLSVDKATPVHVESGNRDPVIVILIPRILGQHRNFLTLRG